MNLQDLQELQIGPVRGTPRFKTPQEQDEFFYNLYHDKNPKTGRSLMDELRECDRKRAESWRYR